MGERREESGEKRKQKQRPRSLVRASWWSEPVTEGLLTRLSLYRSSPKAMEARDDEKSGEGEGGGERVDGATFTPARVYLRRLLSTPALYRSPRAGTKQKEAEEDEKVVVNLRLFLLSLLHFAALVRNSLEDCNTPFQDLIYSPV